MGKYIVKRVLQFIPVFLGVTLILFALQNIVPGDPIKLIGGDKALSPEVELQLRVRYHLVQSDEDGNAILDENGDPVQTSLVDRYLYYMNGLLHGDLGNSYQRKLPVTEIFAQNLLCLIYFYSIVPPPTTTSPSYSTTAWPRVMARWGSSKTTFTRPFSSG